jgi:hypothetical protein
MGLTPAVVRVMTPEETALLIEGWNAAKGGGEKPAAMSRDRFEELKRQYPDG